jgi:hypothetical protein
MIVNVEDVFADKPRFSSLLYIGMAYRKGAGDVAGTPSLLVMLACYLLTFGYPVVVYLQFVVRRKKAVTLYQQHLLGLTELELRTLRAHPKLSCFSMPYVDKVGMDRFG